MQEERWAPASCVVLLPPISGGVGESFFQGRLEGFDCEGGGVMFAGREATDRVQQLRFGKLKDLGNHPALNQLS